ncbi:carbohydrate ABC transporter permease [Streptomyces sp. NPDC051940]|uniref:carbohydrate ABC transporter permease n=1 Tax=Streptomyces sp. NPDC051940 TaxID=3155675 RepID=UPI00344A3FA2
MTAAIEVAQASARARAVRRRRVRSLPLYVIVLLVGALMVTPLLYAAISGFKSTDQISASTFGLPSPWVLENYTDILTSNGFWRSFGSSLLIAVGTTVLTVAAAALAAYPLARFAFRGRELVFTLFAMGLMFPFAAAIVPLFIMLRTMGLLDNPWGVILPQAAFGLPVTIVILRGFFRAIPAELEEAATLDGCGPAGFFWRILLPMARPALGTVSVLAIVGSWNNFLLPLLVFSDQTWWTIPLGVQQFQGEHSADTARIFAYLVLAMVPALGFYAVAERQLIGGITLGATKG